MAPAMTAPASPSIIEPDLLMMAYRSGIFPMSDARDDPEIFWVEPRRRAILPLSFIPITSCWPCCNMLAFRSVRRCCDHNVLLTFHLSPSKLVAFLTRLH